MLFNFLYAKQHIAASKGSENCVLVLLDHGANSNCKGKPDKHIEMFIFTTDV